jgi:hypothetical protein
MSDFNLNWFKTNKELEELQIENEKLKNKILKKQLGEVETPSYTSTSTNDVVFNRPYQNIKLVNDVLTIILNDGSILSKSNATAEDFSAAREAKFVDQLVKLVADPEVVAEKEKAREEYERVKAIRAGIQRLAETGDFTVEGDSVYLKGINRSLPQLLVEHFAAIVDKYTYSDGTIHHGLEDDYQYVALKRFFMWCCLNPRAEVAHELYRFLVENSFRITKQGFFVALRNVVTMHGSPELVHFVSNTYNKVKAVWKKSPDNYHVILKEDGTYEMLHIDDMYENKIDDCEYCDGTGFGPEEDDEDYYDEDYCDDGCCECDGTGKITYSEKTFTGKDLGTLTELYLDLPNREENRFTDDWTKTFDIRIGRPVSMPQEECNWSTQDCAAAGLHFTADQINYVGCGDQSVLVLINPMKVVGIGEHKGRCYEYLPIMTVPREEATTILHDGAFDTLELDDAYAVRELEGLSEKAKEGFAVEAQKYSFNIPAITSFEVDKIVASLDKMNEELSKRVKIVD